LTSKLAGYVENQISGLKDQEVETAQAIEKA
jgi:hypothetical protein